jgi:hypothetical protein
MMHDNNGSYYFGGMHMGWWILILVAVVAVVGWLIGTRKGK